MGRVRARRSSLCSRFPLGRSRAGVTKSNRRSLGNVQSASITLESTETIPLQHYPLDLIKGDLVVAAIV
jgi:hypothetical protein